MFMTVAVGGRFNIITLKQAPVPLFSFWIFLHFRPSLFPLTKTVYHLIYSFLRAFNAIFVTLAIALPSALAI